MTAFRETTLESVLLPKVLCRRALHVGEMNRASEAPLLNARLGIGNLGLTHNLQFAGFLLKPPKRDMGQEVTGRDA